MEPPARSLPPRTRARLIALAAAVVVALAACSLVPGASESPRDAALRVLAERQAQWLARGIDDYSFTMTRQCFCPSTDPFRVTVVDGVTVNVTIAGKPAGPIEVQGLQTTIPALFALVAATAEAGDVAVEWEPTFGFPGSIRADPIPNAVDDEFGITITDFRPIS